MKQRLTPLCTVVALVACLAQPVHAQVAFTLADSLLSSAGFNSAPGCVVDMNNDYLDDIVRIVNDELCVEIQVPDSAGFRHKTYMPPASIGLWSIAAGDVNNNGYTDILLGGGQAVEFLTYDQATKNYLSNALPEYIFSQRSTFADIDNDGWLDAFVCHDVDGNHPYHNDGMGNMSLDFDLIETVNLPGNYSALWTDYDNDEDLDLYVTKCYGGSVSGDPERTNALYQNDGLGNYTNVAQAAGMDDNDQSWSTVFQDFDNDGDFDAFTVNHEFANRFMRNNGDGTFTNIIATTGINEFDLGAWENVTADFDNDGYVDILSELTNELYLNNGDLTFTGYPLPFDEGGIGDFNNDGFVDVFDGNNLYLNNGNANNYLTVELEGTASNRSAIGARVELYGPWGTQMREVRAGTSFSTMGSLNSYFGLGTQTMVDSMMVRWPSGIVQWRFDVAANQAIHIVEGTDPAPSAISEWKGFDGMSLFPNPATHRVTVQLDAAVAETGSTEVFIYDVAGAVVAQERQSAANTITLDIDKLPAGPYLVQVKTGNQPVYTNRLMVK